MAAQMHVVSQLVAKRAELLGDLDYYQSYLNNIMEDLAAVDRSIHLFDPDFPLEKVKARKKNQRLFVTGELTRMILDILREAKEPLMSSQIVNKVSTVKGVDQDDKKIIDVVKVSVQNALYWLAQDNILERDLGKHQGVEALWQVAP